MFIPDVRDAILEWYSTNGRTLAFRRTSDPYAVLVSEVIAQQTQAERAAARWDRFMARFPTVASLAAASPGDVLREWQGLGYDRRGLALWRAARVIRDEHGGHVPSSIEALETLPGVGPYTARAVGAIAFGMPVGAVDVNVERVIGRLTGRAGQIRQRQVQAIADRIAESTDPATWTHAVMDFGASVCRPRNPRCDDCPVRGRCETARAGTQGSVGSPRRARPTTPFPATNRWLRGRILDRLREAPASEWIALDAPVGIHDIDRVRRAAAALAADGMIEIRAGEAGIQARLTTH